MVVIVIGISGCTNSGKTTICVNLKKMYPRCFLIKMDDFFLPDGHSNLTRIEQLNCYNWDELKAVDTSKMYDNIVQIVDLYQSSEQTYILLIDGILVFNYTPFLKFYKKLFFITLTKDICMQRRCNRHYIPPDVSGYFDTVVWPQYLKNKKEIEYLKDIVYLDGSEKFDKVLNKVKQEIDKVA